MDSQINNFGLGNLNPKEAALIRIIREEYKFGKVEIQTKDGLPYQLLETIKRRML